MTTTKSKLQKVLNSKKAIKAAIQEMTGKDPGDNFSTYASTIKTIKGPSEVTASDVGLVVSGNDIPSTISSGGLIGIVPMESDSSDLSNAYQGCTGIISVNLEKLANGTTLSSLRNTFDGCSNIETVEFGNVSIDNLDMTMAFNNCSSLSTLDFGTVDLSKISHLDRAFSNCPNLCMDLELLGIDFRENLISASEAFAGSCISSIYIDDCEFSDSDLSYFCYLTVNSESGGNESSCLGYINIEDTEMSNCILQQFGDPFLSLNPSGLHLTRTDFSGSDMISAFCSNTYHKNSTVKIPLLIDGCNFTETRLGTTFDKYITDTDGSRYSEITVTGSNFTNAKFDRTFNCDSVNNNKITFTGCNFTGATTLLSTEEGSSEKIDSAVTFGKSSNIVINSSALDSFNGSFTYCIDNNTTSQITLNECVDLTSTGPTFTMDKGEYSGTNRTMEIIKSTLPGSVLEFEYNSLSISGSDLNSSKFFEGYYCPSIFHVSESNLSGSTFYVDFSDSDISISNSDFSSSVFCGSSSANSNITITDSDFSYINTNNSGIFYDATEVRITGTTFDNSSLQYLFDTTDVSVQGSNFLYCDLSNSFSSSTVNLGSTDFSYSSLDNAFYNSTISVDFATSTFTGCTVFSNIFKEAKINTIVDFSTKELPNANFSNAFITSNLYNNTVNFNGCNLQKANFSDAFNGASQDQGNEQQLIFSNAILNESKFTSTFSGFQGGNILFKEANLADADFEGSFSYSKVLNIDFDGSDLSRADFTSAFTEADTLDISFINTTLTDAIFSNTFINAKLNFASFNGSESIGGTRGLNLSSAFSEAVSHGGNAEGIFIDCRELNAPVADFSSAFLKISCIDNYIVFDNSILNNSDFTDAFSSGNINGVSFNYSTLTNSDFTQAFKSTEINYNIEYIDCDLTGTSFDYFIDCAKIGGDIDFTDSNLSGISMTKNDRSIRVDVGNLYFTNTTLTGSNLESAFEEINFGFADFSNCKSTERLNLSCLFMGAINESFINGTNYSIDFSNSSLPGTDFSGAFQNMLKNGEIIFNKAILNGSNFTNAFSDTSVNGIIFTEAELNNVDFTSSNSHPSMEGDVKFNKSKSSGVKFIKTFYNSSIKGCIDFSEANLTGSDFSNAFDCAYDISYVTFADTTLTNSTLDYALSGTIISGDIIFSGSNLDGSSLTNAFGGISVSTVDFLGASLTKTNFTNAFNNSTINDVNFKNTTSTDTINFTDAFSYISTNENVDFSGSNYYYANFTNMFSSANISGDVLFTSAVISDSDFTSAFSGATINNINFNSADLSNSDFTDAFNGVTLNNLSLVDTVLTGSIFTNAFNGASISSGVDFSGNDFSEKDFSKIFEYSGIGGTIDFSECNLSGTNLTDAFNSAGNTKVTFAGTQAVGAILSNAFNTSAFTEVDFSGCDLSGSSLDNLFFSSTTGAIIFSNTNLSNTNLSSSFENFATEIDITFDDCDMSGANLTNMFASSGVTSVDFSCADLTGATINGCFKGCANLTEVYLLEDPEKLTFNEELWADISTSGTCYVDALYYKSEEDAPFGALPSNWSYEPIEYVPDTCTELVIYGVNASKNSTSTTIYYTAKTNGYTGNKYIEGRVLSGIGTSSTFAKNTSSNDVTRTISFTYLGKTATTKIIQKGVEIATVSGEWSKCDDLGFGAYKSPTINDGEYTTSTITITGTSTFVLNILSSSEGSCDYVMASQPNVEIDVDTNPSDSSMVMGSTYNSGYDGDVNSAITLTYTGLSTTQTYNIYVVYRKDGSVSVDNDAGYFWFDGAGNSDYLPSGYTRLEYIQSTGTQYINTGFKPNQDTRVVMNYQATSITANAWAFGGRDSYTQNSMCVFYYYSSGKLWNADYSKDTNRKTFSGISATARINLDFNKNKCTMNDKTVINGIETYQSNYPIALFAVNNSGTISGYLKAKLYSCQIYDNGMLVRRYIPCKNASGVAGLYDVINDTFTKSGSSTAFTAGPTM